METFCPVPLGHCTCPPRHLVLWERQGLVELDLQLAPVSAWRQWALASPLLINWACVSAAPWSPGLRLEGGEYHGCLPSALKPSLLKEIKGLSPAPLPLHYGSGCTSGSPVEPVVAEARAASQITARVAQALYQPELRTTASMAAWCLRPPGLSFLP